jgi:CRISPR/Cas system CMR-associated protein Cmr5 small subunit
MSDLGYTYYLIEVIEDLEAERDKLREAAQAVVDFTGYAPEAQRIDVWNMRIAKLNAALVETEK